LVSHLTWTCELPDLDSELLAKGRTCSGEELCEKERKLKLL